MGTGDRVKILHDKIEEHQGEYILAVENRDVQVSGCYMGLSTKPRTKKVWRYSFGIIDGSVEWANGEIILPVNPFVQIGSLESFQRDYFEKWRKREEKLRVKDYYFRSNFFVGNEEVDLYFTCPKGLEERLFQSTINKNERVLSWHKMYPGQRNPLYDLGINALD